jgi:hypothetical protein
MYDDDGFEFVIFFFVLPVLFFILICSFVGISKNVDKEEKKEDKRYELCLKRDMQWVEGNCIAK